MKAVYTEPLLGLYFVWSCICSPMFKIYLNLYKGTYRRFSGLVFLFRVQFRHLTVYMPRSQFYYIVFVRKQLITSSKLKKTFIFVHFIFHFTSSIPSIPIDTLIALVSFFLCTVCLKSFGTGQI